MRKGKEAMDGGLLRGRQQMGSSSPSSPVEIPSRRFPQNEVLLDQEVSFLYSAQFR